MKELVNVSVGEDGQQRIVLSSLGWDDPAGWGLLLVDIARHVAAFYQRELGFSREDTLKRILIAFHAELTAPTDSV